MHHHSGAVSLENMQRHFEHITGSLKKSYLYQRCPWRRGSGRLFKNSSR